MTRMILNFACDFFPILSDRSLYEVSLNIFISQFLFIICIRPHVNLILFRTKAGSGYHDNVCPAETQNFAAFCLSNELITYTPLSAYISFRAIEPLTIYAANARLKRYAFHSLLTVRWFLFHVSQFEKAQLARNTMGLYVHSRSLCVFRTILFFFYRISMRLMGKGLFSQALRTNGGQTISSYRRKDTQFKMALANWVNVWYAIFSKYYTNTFSISEFHGFPPSRFFCPSLVQRCSVICSSLYLI